MHEAVVAFCAALQESSAPAECAEIEGHLRPRLHAAETKYPDLSVPAARFGSWLASRIPMGTGVLEAINRIHLEDLYLAFGCAQGDAAALSAFERDYRDDLRRAHQRMGGDAPSYDDFVQTLRQKLFAHQDPKISGYTGQASLRAWLRVAAARTLLNMKRGQGRELALEDERLGALPAPTDDPELAYFKHHYREAFQHAFIEAARSLGPEDRNVLRSHYAQHLSIDQIAATRGIHRATAARRLGSARERLLAETRRLLHQRLGVGRAELESLMRLVESQLHLSVQRLFESQVG